MKMTYEKALIIISNPDCFPENQVTQAVSYVMGSNDATNDDVKQAIRLSMDKVTKLRQKRRQ